MNEKLTLLGEEEWNYDPFEIKSKLLEKYSGRFALSNAAKLTGSVFCINNCEHVTFWLKSTRTEYKVLDKVFLSNLTYGTRYQNASSYDPVILPVLPLTEDIEKRIKSKYKAIKDYGIEFAEYGESPLSIADEIIMQSKLEELYKKNKLKKTGRHFTYNDNSINKNKINLVKYDEYIYNNRKYIRLKVTLNEKYSSVKFRYTYKTGDYVWIKVEKIIWIVDRENKRMISTIGLPSGMRFDSPRKENINFNKSELKWYLDNYMSKEIFQSIKEQEETKEDTTIKEKTKIDILLDELEKEIKSYLGNKEIVYNYIDNLIEDYNKSLDKLNINKDLVLDRRESLELQLQIRLEQILTKIKNSNDKEIEKILNIINICIDKLNGKEIEDTNELYIDISLLNDKILPFLLNEKEEYYKNILLNMFVKEKNKLDKYCNSINVLNIEVPILEKPYNKEEDFVYGIREKLNTILLEVNAEVIKTDIIKEIINTYKNIMDNNYSEAKNKNIKLYLELIQELSRFIEENGNTLEKENLIKILNNNINYQNEIEEVMTTLLDNIISLYKLKYRVENRIKTEKEIESSKIKRKLKR
mgnify:CR=1 FL=1